MNISSGRTTTTRLAFCLWMVVVVVSSRTMVVASAFVSSPTRTSTTSTVFRRRKGSSGFTTVLFSSESSDTAAAAANPKQKKPKRTSISIKEYAQEILDNPAKFFPDSSSQKTRKKSTYKRTRKRVENPQQTYLYAKQRRALQQQQTNNTETADPTAAGEAETPAVLPTQVIQELIQELNMVKPSTMHCDPLYKEQPQLLGKIWVSTDHNDTSSSNSYAYIINKPAGWAIVGTKPQISMTEATSTTTTTTTPKQQQQANEEKTQSKQQPSTVQRVKVVDDDGTVGYVEYNEQDVFDLMTKEEIEQFLEDGGEIPPGVVLGGRSSSSYKPKNRFLRTSSSPTTASPDSTSTKMKEYPSSQNPTTLENLRRIKARVGRPGDLSSSIASKTTASFANPPRPSVVNWLKETMEQRYERTIRGGNFWKAIAGATHVDDSGLVLLCPKTATNNVFCDSIRYTAIVGNGGEKYMSTTYSAPNKKKKTEAKIDMQVIAKLKTARGDDKIEIVQIDIPELMSNCDDVVTLCQEEWGDGIRGDQMSQHPLERRARRRLIHCQAMAVSSLTQDDSVRVETPTLPDDIAVLAERGRNKKSTYCKNGSFLGRAALQQSDHTNAYREINGAADGFPGWTVDRYDKWLLVQHDPDLPRGPLPSIHDGKTAGVYYLEATPDRSSMGTEDSLRPRLLEGQPAPDLFPVLENGIRYMVSLDKDLSTGIFLDQRPQRQWLASHCGPETRVLNCFAHTGAFSVAAAVAGASTVSVDLSKKWLDRLPLHFQANDGLEFHERHDAIYGDCFDWLARLAKRGEKYDVVILDPPSASVGGRKKKRWSVKNDMDELVSLASELVVPGGLLWTTTNNAGIPAVKFARLCRKGLEQAGVPNAKLERIQPMPSDFQTIGPQNVKNLVWRFPSL